MAKPRLAPLPTPPKRSSEVWRWIGEVLAKLIDRFGWPGVFLIAASYFIERHASQEQKKEIIDKFVLGKGIDGHYVQLLIVFVFGVLFVAQHILWRRKFDKVSDEMKRLAKWKSDHQSGATGSGLHHTEGT